MKDGGSAFPTGLGCMERGMTLRDWFAGQALAGIMACQSAQTDRYVARECAEDAYLLADAMLAQREEREEE